MNLNLLGIDFEEWYHLELVQKNFKREKEMKPTVIQGIDKILDWLRKNETLATFFVVGELLEFKEVGKDTQKLKLKEIINLITEQKIKN